MNVESLDCMCNSLVFSCPSFTRQCRGAGRCWLTHSGCSTAPLILVLHLCRLRCIVSLSTAPPQCSGRSLLMFADVWTETTTAVMTCPFLVTSSQQQENCHVTLRISRFMVRHQCVQVFKTLLRIKIDRNRYLSTVYTWVYKTITFLSFACPLPPPAPAVAVCPHDGAPDDCTCWWWHVRDDEGVLLAVRI